jgi:hypothetical protein
LLSARAGDAKPAKDVRLIIRSISSNELSKLATRDYNMIKVRAMLIAEYAGLATDGKLTVAGIFDGMNVTRRDTSDETPVSVAISRAYLVIVSEASLADGLAHTFVMRILNGNGTPIIDDIKMPFSFALSASGRPMKNNLIANISGLTFPGVDDYTFELRIEGQPQFVESLVFNVGESTRASDG